MILNEKYNIVAKVNIEFNPYQWERFRDWVIVSVEKNRGGQDQVDLEFEKHFEFSYCPAVRIEAGELEVLLELEVHLVLAAAVLLDRDDDPVTEALRLGTG